MTQKSTNLLLTWNKHASLALVLLFGQIASSRFAASQGANLEMKWRHGIDFLSARRASTEFLYLLASCVMFLSVQHSCDILSAEGFLASLISHVSINRFAKCYVFPATNQSTLLRKWRCCDNHRAELSSGLSRTPTWRSWRRSPGRVPLKLTSVHVLI